MKLDKVTAVAFQLPEPLPLIDWHMAVVGTSAPLKDLISLAGHQTSIHFDMSLSCFYWPELNELPLGFGLFQPCGRPGPPDLHEY